LLNTTGEKVWKKKVRKSMNATWYQIDATEIENPLGNHTANYYIEVMSSGRIKNLEITAFRILTKMVLLVAS